MHKRAIAATIAALFALVLIAVPASADTEYAGAPTTIDWRLVVVLVLVALVVFVAALGLANRGR
jgi:hypothetical protein